MDAATAGDEWSRCRHHLWLQLLLPLSLIPFYSLCLRWIWNDRAAFSIIDGGRQVFETAERSGSAANGGCEAGYNATHWVCLWGYFWCWCPMTASTQGGGGSSYWPSLYSGCGESYTLSDICNKTINQRRWGRGVLNLICRGDGTASLRAIPLAGQ